MSLITAQNLSLAFGPKIILDEASFTLNARDRVGLVGPNGTGKSTLLKILAGAREPDSGTFTSMRGTRVGYLPQDILEMPQGSLIDTVLAAVPDRARLSQRQAALESALAESRDEDEELQLDLATQLTAVHEELLAFEERYGRHQAERILMGLGFRVDAFDRPVSILSGGWKMRAALAGLLLSGPDLLLLDEPTNHLDLTSLVWLDAFLRRSPHALMLVSHDRDFLNRQIDRVLSFEPEGLRGYSGNYDDYRQQRTEEEEQLAARVKRQTAQRAATEAFIERFRYKATKARQVQSRIRQLDKEEVLTVLERRAAIAFRFPEVARSGQDVLTLQGIDKAFGSNVVYRDLTQTVRRGERIAIIGANGAGKTTLLKIVAGELPQDRGEVTCGLNVQMAYYAQHHTELLDPRKTILDEIWSLVPDRPQSWVRGVLGAFLFTGDDVDKRIAVLSGGERARVALARLLVIPSNLILMDEPTNHLDIDSADRLIEALKGYGGTLLFVSHNRAFIDALATRVWDVQGGGIVDWPGNLSDYLHHLEVASAAQGRDATPRSPTSTSTSSDAGKEKETDKERRRREAEARNAMNAKLRPLREARDRCEKEIAELEKEQAELEPKLADGALYDDFATARALTERYEGNAQALEDAMARWAEAQETLEALESALSR
ncbi:MAG: ABC-F family ATP-binding cassette domain-containing protein [Myxococcales bacterium]|jgi:ATP-binding cassette subfamily F protein 3|nr:ABC-F family ATP-binding cassette domain-containing protein [Myxococcales bacterium]